MDNSLISKVVLLDSKQLLGYTATLPTVLHCVPLPIYYVHFRNSVSLSPYLILPLTFASIAFLQPKSVPTLQSSHPLKHQIWHLQTSLN